MADDWDMDDAFAPASAGGGAFGGRDFGDDDMPDALAAGTEAGGDWSEDIATYVVPGPPPTVINDTGYLDHGLAAPPPSRPSPPAPTGYGGSSGAQDFMQNFQPTDSHSSHPLASTDRKSVV